MKLGYFDLRSLKLQWSLAQDNIWPHVITLSNFLQNIFSL